MTLHRIISSVALLALLVSPHSWAHEQHSHIADGLVSAFYAGLAHPFTGIDHLLTLLLGGVLLALIGLQCPSRRRTHGLPASALLALMLAWSLVHYSGHHWLSYGLGYLFSSYATLALTYKLAGVIKTAGGCKAPKP